MNSGRYIDATRIIKIEFVPEGQFVTQKYYRQCPIKLREIVKKKRPNFWKDHSSWILHQDYEPVHNALFMKQFSVNKHIPVLESPLYLPDLAPCGLYLFSNLKSGFKGTHYQSVGEVKVKNGRIVETPDNNGKHVSSNIQRGEWSMSKEIKSQM